MPCECALRSRIDVRQEMRMRIACAAHFFSHWVIYLYWIHRCLPYLVQVYWLPVWICFSAYSWRIALQVEFALLFLVNLIITVTVCEIIDTFGVKVHDYHLCWSLHLLCLCEDSILLFTERILFLRLELSGLIPIFTRYQNESLRFGNTILRS